MNQKNHYEKNNTENRPKRKLTSKQLVAMLGIVLLVLLYLVTLIAAFTDHSAQKSLFRICLFATVAIPLLIWIYIWMYGKLTQKHTIADLDIGKSPSGSDSKTK